MPAVASPAVMMTPAMIRRRMAPPWSTRVPSFFTRMIGPAHEAPASDLLWLREDWRSSVANVRDTGAQEWRRGASHPPFEGGGNLGQPLGGLVDHVPPRELEVDPAHRLAAVALHGVLPEGLRRVVAA